MLFAYEEEEEEKEKTKPFFLDSHSVTELFDYYRLLLQQKEMIPLCKYLHSFGDKSFLSIPSGCMHQQQQQQ